MIDDARDLCDLLTHFNVTGDPALERARKQLADMIDGVTTDALRTEEDTRVAIHNQAKAILNAYEWGMGEDSLADAA